MNSLYADLLYLLGCAADGRTPDAARTAGMDPAALYQLSKTHTVRAAVYLALKSAGIDDPQLRQAYFNAVRKNILLDAERTDILAGFETHGIWYMPLKGAILHTLYPASGMREMADNDVLYDSTPQETVREIMLARGYTAEDVGRTHHDVYMKPPVLNMELHTTLFGRDLTAFYAYYADPMRLMQRDADKTYGYHLSDEDMYVYMTAHEYKHFSKGGTGIRSLLDCYVYCKVKGDALDWAYIEAQCETLGIAAFEQSRRALAQKVFPAEVLPALDEEETALLKAYLLYGTYGTITHAAETRIKAYPSKAAFVRARLFPDLAFMERWYPFFYKHKWLLPVGYVWRWIKGITVSRQKVATELRVLLRREHRDDT